MKLRVTTHSQENFEVEVEEFNSKEFETKLNDGEINAIELGGMVISRIDIKLIKPIIETEDSKTEK